MADNKLWDKLRPFLRECDEELIGICQVLGSDSCIPVDDTTMRNAVIIVLKTLQKHKRLYGMEYIEELLTDRSVVLPINERKE